MPILGQSRGEGVTKWYHKMVDSLDHSLLTALRTDSDIVNLFLFGHKELSTEKNTLIFEMAQTYINASERFSSISHFSRGKMTLRVDRQHHHSSGRGILFFSSF